MGLYYDFKSVHRLYLHVLQRSVSTVANHDEGKQNAFLYIYLILTRTNY